MGFKRASGKYQTILEFIVLFVGFSPIFWFQGNFRVVFKDFLSRCRRLCDFRRWCGFRRITGVVESVKEVTNRFQSDVLEGFQMVLSRVSRGGGAQLIRGDLHEALGDFMNYWEFSPLNVWEDFTRKFRGVARLFEDGFCRFQGSFWMGLEVYPEFQMGASRIF